MHVSSPDGIGSIGLDPRLFGTHSLRRTKPTLIYRRTGNLRAVQLLLGHTKIESTVRYLGIEVDDALSELPGQRTCSAHLKMTGLGSQADLNFLTLAIFP